MEKDDAMNNWTPHKVNCDELKEIREEKSQTR